MIQLSTTMQINAITSGTTGIGLITVAGPIAGLFGVTETWPFIAAGIFLVLFSIYVFAVSKGKPVNPGGVRLVILMDVLWVVASIIAILALFSVISGIGSLAIGAVAVWVAGMALLQYAGLKVIA
ncbi:hypothetical protein GFS24_27685 [Chitinophaga sp. SYP-B3965]|uniref:hypothetical protein n=1 Tax=Chitinophaga sp. SYP-B3965 TaxID=2663120 RepID=UPI0012995713|nr:hypothetical protein [Chitinophaga sp. SYP-B3965]MRG48924.1 hypothetical protein [Chitinophaga sp. SYP-B3965]